MLVCSYPCIHQKDGLCALDYAARATNYHSQPQAANIAASGTTAIQQTAEQPRYDCIHYSRKK